MRLFPRTARRRLVATAAVCSLAVVALAVPFASADDKGLKDKQKHAQSQVHHAQQDLDESSSRLRSTQAALAKAKTDLTSARADYKAANAKLTAAEIRDQEMQDQLDAAEQQLTTAEQDLTDGQSAVAAQRQTVTDTVTSIYEEGDPELLAFSALLNSQTASDLTRQDEARDVIVGRQTRAYADLHAAEVLLQVRETQVQAARDAVEVQRQAAADHLVTMQQLRTEAGTARDQVRATVQARRTAASAARSARTADLQDLQRAKKHEQRIRQQLLAAARHARGGYTGSTNGLLIRPVPGPITSPFGYRIHPIYHYWGLHDGTDFGVACGEGMKAVASGTVVASYWSDVYGNRLYVSLGNINGKNVTAVYNHASGYRVDVGDHVSQGEVVGYVGMTGWTTGCHLHFTILVNGTAVDPMTWLP